MAELHLNNLHFQRGSFTLSMPELFVESGEKVAVLGENGSGKSTLFQLLTGLLSGKGELNYRGHSLAQMQSLEKARHFALLPQQAEVIFPFPVFEVVLLGRYSLSESRSFSPDDEERTRTLLKRLDLAELSERSFNELSGGEQRRVMLARVLNQETPLVYLDEPNASLDVRHSLDLFDFLTRSNRTVIASVHDINLAARFFKRFWLLKQGKLIADLSREELSCELLSETYNVQVSAGTDSFSFSR